MPIDEMKLNEFMGKIVGDLGVTMSARCSFMGDRLGLYKAMAAMGPVTAAELAQRTETTERYVREWLDAQAACGLRHLRLQGTSATPCRPSRRSRSPTTTARRSWPALSASRGRCGARSTRWKRTFAPATGSSGGINIRASSRAPSGSSARATWQPGQLVDSRARGRRRRSSKRGAKVADVGCGLGASTHPHGEGVPEVDVSRVRLPPGIDRARDASAPRRRASADRVTFRSPSRPTFPGTGYDLGRALRLPARHGGSGRRAAKHARTTLAKDGTWLIVEPFASDKAEENHNPVGRVFYSASTMLCVPHSLAHQGPGARRAGRRSASARGRRRQGRLLALPSRDADALQPHARSAALRVAGTKHTAGAS